jgi:hypothetical protein
MPEKLYADAYKRLPKEATSLPNKATELTDRTLGLGETVGRNGRTTTLSA